MDLYEYQARDVFERHHIPVLPGAVARTADEVVAAAERVAGPQGKVVIKAQVKTGGRGKAGGVKLAQGHEQIRQVAQAILGMDIKGHTVHQVMVSPTAEILQEYYFSLLLDRANRTFLAMASTQGGMDIEEVAEKHPDQLMRMPVDALRGIDEALARQIVTQANFPAEVADQVVALLPQLWQLFVAEDATLVEINPLAQVRDPDGTITVRALDGKVTFDENAAFRHPEHVELTDIASTDPLEVAAQQRGLNYVKLDGSVGIIGNGAGLVMSTLDVVAGAGEQHGGMRPANFLDIGGGASAQVMADGLEIIMSDPAVRSIFVNVFGGITACDAVANGIVQALHVLSQRGEQVAVPLVVRLDGNNAELGRSILDQAAHPMVSQVGTMDEAADKAAQLAAA